MTSTVTISPADAPATARVTFENDEVHPTSGSFILELDGVTVELVLKVGHGHGNPDVLRATPMDGYIAIPDEITVGEGASGELLIYPLGAVGM